MGIVASLNVAAALPEILLAVAGMALLMLGVFTGDRGSRLVTGFSMAALLVVLAVVAGATHRDGILALGGLFRSDAFGNYMKVLVLIGALTTLVLSFDYFEREKLGRFEYPVLVLMATLGMLMMVSANDLMSLYVGLELQSLSLYVIAAFRRDSARSTEAGLKYFVLGALSSGMLLYGASLVYGFTGSTNFDQIAQSFGGATAPMGVVIGLIFVVSGLAFKVSAVPFHMWTPDVYEGAPTPVTAFFAVAPKIAALALFSRVMLGPFRDLIGQWQQVIQLIAIGSMLLGAFAAIQQTNIKRLMAYSSIGHMGYVLIGIACGSQAGVSGIIIYMAIYIAMNVGTFGCILAMRSKGQMVEEISDLAGLARTRPLMALALAVFMFSMAGVPPLAGFFGKLYVFLAAIEAKLYTLAVIGVLSSVVGAYYYLRIVKIMYFDEARVQFEPMAREVAVVTTLATLFTVFFVLWPTPIIARATAAAAALIGG